MKNLVLLTISILLSTSVAFGQEVKKYPYMDMVSGNNPFAWKVQKTAWSAQDEADFGAFVQRIGLSIEKGRCNNFVSCMTNPTINPFFTSDPAGIRYYADCADVPYWLRTYFAWKKGLPLSLAVGTAPRDPNDPVKDNRNSTISGNLITLRADSVSNGRFPNVTQFLSSTTTDGLILDSISSGTYRTPVIPEANEPLADFYPVAIRRGSVKPGTVVYTADGHVATVYKVEADGSIGTLNGSPSDQNAANTPLTVRAYNNTFKRSRQEHGSIFKNFRPLELIGARPDAEGNLIGGTIVLKSNADIITNPNLPAPSTEQVTLHFESPADYYLFVRKRMADGALKMDVLTEFRRSLKDVCDIVQGRVAMVNQAIAAGMDQKTLDVAPANIFSSQGDWENYSTPSRDVNIRTLFKETLDGLKAGVRGFRSGNKIYTYSGKNLSQDLFDIYRSKASSCTVTYTSRAGVTKTLDLEQVRLKMFKISFDPYQCTDLRWGDSATGQQVCGEDMRWYNAEQYLRNLTTKAAGNTPLTVDQMEVQNQQQNKALEWTTNIIGYIQEVAQVTGVHLN